MNHERTIVISEQLAQQTKNYLNGTAEFKEQERPLHLKTEFDSGIQVFIDLELGEKPQVRAAFCMGHSLIASVSEQEEVLGAFIFNMEDATYTVHVTTPEMMEKGKTKRKQQPIAMFKPKKRRKKREHIWYQLLGWDEVNEKLEELAEHEEVYFSSQKELDAHLTDGAKHIWKHYSLTDSKTDNEIFFDIPQTAKDAQDKLEELRKWLDSLHLTFDIDDTTGTK